MLLLGQLRPKIVYRGFIRFRAMAIDASPPINRWMKEELVKDAFRKTLPVLAAQVPPTKTGSMLKAPALRNFLLDLPRWRNVVSDPSSPRADRLLLLRVSNEAELSPEAREFLNAEQTNLVPYNIDLTYDYWTADDIIKAILPEEVLGDGAPTGFAVTGHIAHMNLQAEYLPYKHIIGQIILEKNPQLKTVVNKLDSIDTKFRFFKMELLAGVPNYVVEHREADCRFTFDFTKVYWNSRLATEHERIVNLFKPEDVVADVFAGVGPFALPAAKRGCGVLANDLNPGSFEYLQQNIRDNLVPDLVRPSCEDGRDFIRASIAQTLDTPFPAYAGPKASLTQQRKAQKEKKRRAASPTATALSPPRRRISHFVMNLPDSAITFLDAFRGLLASENVGGRNLSGVYDEMPLVHCHCFTRETEPTKAEVDIRQRVEEMLKHPLEEETSLHLVRSVAPNKDMYCISFRLPRAVAFAQ